MLLLYIIIMFEGVLGLSAAFSEISLQKLSIIVDPKPPPLHRLVDAALDRCFQPDSPPPHLVEKEGMGVPTRAEFFSAFRKALTRYLKKYARTIEELALHRERNGGGKEWLREFMDNLETIASNVYKYARAVENTFLWQNCRSTLCEDKRSFGAFQRNIITFITDASDKAGRSIKEAIRNNEISHPFVAGEEVTGRVGAAEIELEMQESCEQLHGKQKKKKKKKKAKESPKEKQQSSKVEKDGSSDEEKELINFLLSMELDQDRQQCPLSQEWIADIGPSSFFKQ